MGSFRMRVGKALAKMTDTMVLGIPGVDPNGDRNNAINIVSKEMIVLTKWITLQLKR